MFTAKTIAKVTQNASLSNALMPLELANKKLSKSTKVALSTDFRHLEGQKQCLTP